MPRCLALLISLVVIAEPLSAQGGPSKKQIRQAVNSGVHYLQGQQRINGKWLAEESGDDPRSHRGAVNRRSDTKAHRGAVTSLCVLALLKSGCTTDDRFLKNSLKYLASIESNSTYSISLQTIALAQADPKQYRDIIARNIALLNKTQILLNKTRIISESQVASLGVSEDYLQEAKAKEKKEARWRLDHYRKDRAKRDLKFKKVIIVDDGLATGSTMRAAIRTVRAEEAKEIIMAVPVAPPDTLEKIKKEVDHAVCLSTPPDFYAVGQFYEHFDQTADEEVISLLRQDTAKQQK